MGLRLLHTKCVFKTSSVVWLGHHINAEGVHMVYEKKNAIQDVPKPMNHTALQAYLGLMSYYHHFLEKLATLLLYDFVAIKPALVMGK